MTGQQPHERGLPDLPAGDDATPQELHPDLTHLGKVPAGSVPGILQGQRTEFRTGRMGEIIRDAEDGEFDRLKVLYAEGALADREIIPGDLSRELKIAYGTGQISLRELVERALDEDRTGEELDAEVREYLSVTHPSRLIVSYREGRSADAPWAKLKVEVAEDAPDPDESSEDARPKWKLVGTYLNGKSKDSQVDVIGLGKEKITLANPKPGGRPFTRKTDETAYVVVPKNGGAMTVIRPVNRGSQDA
jgi:hypothetical protein